MSEQTLPFNDNRFYRANDLIEVMHLFENRQSLKNAIGRGDFPPGELTATNTRTWHGAVLNKWHGGRPTAPRVLPQFASHRRAGRPRKSDNNNNKAA